MKTHDVMQSSWPTAVAIIPARGGSRGLPKKNIYPFVDAPLISYTIRQALSAQSMQRVLVSTDDAEIAEVARTCGAEIIWRPSELSGATATSESALLHTLEVLKAEKQFMPEYVAFLQCTSPLRQPQDLDAAFEKLLLRQADSLLSVTPSHCFIWKEQNGTIQSVNYDYRKRPRRQEFGVQYVENGAIYICRTEVLQEHKNRIGGRICIYEMEPWQAFEIDDLHDLRLCEWLYREYLHSRVLHGEHQHSEC